MNPLSLSIPKEEITSNRRAIKTEFITSSSFLDKNTITIRPDHVASLFFEYDNVFFDKKLSARLLNRISFACSTRMTKTGGKVTRKNREGTYILTVSEPLICKSIFSKQDGVLVNGLKCHDSVDAMMGIIEHEMIHIIEFEYFGKSSCGKKRFKTLAHNIFGHTDTKHNLRLKPMDGNPIEKVTIGTQVRFEHNNIPYSGVVSRVTKRATVVLDTSCNKKYKKMYVPISFLALKT